MAPLPVTFSELECALDCLKPFYLTCLRKYSVDYQRYVYTIHMNRNAHMTCNVNYLFKNELLLRSQPVM